MMSNDAEQPTGREKRRRGLAALLIMNALIWLFCLFQIFLFESLYVELRFMILFFVMFALLFSLLSLADCVFAVLASRREQKKQTESKLASET